MRNNRLATYKSTCIIEKQNFIMFTLYKCIKQITKQLRRTQQMHKTLSSIFQLKI